MLVRIVRLSVKKENIASFEQLFGTTGKTIREFEGCSLFALYRDTRDSGIFFTHNHWESVQALEDYRNSEFFRTIWGKSKKLFFAEAWSPEPLKLLN